MNNEVVEGLVQTALYNRMVPKARLSLFQGAKPLGHDLANLLSLLEAEKVSGTVLLDGRNVPAFKVGRSISNFMYVWASEDRKSTRLNSSHITRSRMPSSA